MKQNELELIKAIGQFSPKNAHLLEKILGSRSVLKFPELNKNILIKQLELINPENVSQRVALIKELKELFYFFLTNPIYQLNPEWIKEDSLLIKKLIDTRSGAQDIEITISIIAKITTFLSLGNDSTIPFVQSHLSEWLIEDRKSIKKSIDACEIAPALRIMESSLQFGITIKRNNIKLPRAITGRDNETPKEFNNPNTTLSPTLDLAPQLPSSSPATAASPSYQGKPTAQQPSFFAQPTPSRKQNSGYLTASVTLGLLGGAGIVFAIEPLAWGLGLVLFSISPPIFIATVALYALIVAACITAAVICGNLATNNTPVVSP